MDGVAALERASALCDLGRWDEAAVQLRTILGTDPHNEDGRCLLAQAELGRNDNDQALQSALVAISLNPENEWPHRIASLALSELGRDQEANVMARNAVRLAPHEAQCHINLAQLLALCDSDLDEARTVADRAVVLAPHHAGSHIAVGHVAAADARTDEAATAFHRALALEPDNTAAHNGLARLQLSKGRFGNAGGLAIAAGGFADALRADPRAEVSRSNLDLVLHVFLIRTTFGIFLIAAIVGKGLRNSDDAFLRLLPALLLVFPALFVARFVSGLAPQLRSYLLRLLRNPFIAGAVTCASIAAVALVVGAAFQGATSVAFMCAAGSAAVARLILWLETRRKFKALLDPGRQVSVGLMVAVGAVIWLLVIIAVYARIQDSGDWMPVLMLFTVAMALTLAGAAHLVRRKK
jgi:Flp pilus assembly protein TadD